MRLSHEHSSGPWRGTCRHLQVMEDRRQSGRPHRRVETRQLRQGGHGRRRVCVRRQHRPRSRWIASASKACASSRSSSRFHWGSDSRSTAREPSRRRQAHDLSRLAPLAQEALQQPSRVHNALRTPGGLQDVDALVVDAQEGPSSQPGELLAGAAARQRRTRAGRPPSRTASRSAGSERRSRPARRALRTRLAAPSTRLAASRNTTATASGIEPHVASVAREKSGHALRDERRLGLSPDGLAEDDPALSRPRHRLTEESRSRAAPSSPFLTGADSRTPHQQPSKARRRGCPDRRSARKPSSHGSEIVTSAPALAHAVRTVRCRGDRSVAPSTSMRVVEGTDECEDPRDASPRSTRSARDKLGIIRVEEAEDVFVERGLGREVFTVVLARRESTGSIAPTNPGSAGRCCHSLESHPSGRLPDQQPAAAGDRRRTCRLPAGHHVWSR